MWNVDNVTVDSVVSALEETKKILHENGYSGIPMEIIRDYVLAQDKKLKELVV